MIARRAANHLTHPWKVEARAYSDAVHRSVLVGRAMFMTREEAEKWAEGGEGCLVLASRPGDVEFA